MSLDAKYPLKFSIDSSNIILPSVVILIFFTYIAAYVSNGSSLVAQKLYPFTLCLNIKNIEQYTPETEHDLKQIVQLIEASETFELGSLQSDLDKVFEQVKTVDPNSDALKKYNYWKYLTTIKKNISNHPTPQWKIV